MKPKKPQVVDRSKRVRAHFHCCVRAPAQVMVRSGRRAEGEVSGLTGVASFHQCESESSLRGATAASGTP